MSCRREDYGVYSHSVCVPVCYKLTAVYVYIYHRSGNFHVKKFQGKFS